MFFSSAITAFLAISVVSASPLKRRDTATVLGDIQTISSDVATLQADVNAFDGSLTTGLTLATDEETLNSKIESTTTDIDNTAAFDTADSTSVTDATNTLTPTIVAVLNSLAAKQSTAAAAGLDGIIESALETLKTNTDALFAALEAKVDAGDVAAVTADQASVDAAFTAAIGEF